VPIASLDDPKLTSSAARSRIVIRERTEAISFASSGYAFSRPRPPLPEVTSRHVRTLARGPHNRLVRSSTTHARRTHADRCIAGWTVLSVVLLH
jgi:hypothetical protein